MGSVENAKMLSPFANYMIGSEELESGGGWDYAAIGAYLRKIRELRRQILEKRSVTFLQKLRSTRRRKYGDTFGDGSVEDSESLR